MYPGKRVSPPTPRRTMPAERVLFSSAFLMLRQVCLRLTCSLRGQLFDVRRKHLHEQWVGLGVFDLLDLGSEQKQCDYR